MNKKRNKFNQGVFERAKLSLEGLYPQFDKKAFYVKNPQESGLPKSMLAVAVSMVCGIVGEKLNLRTYRKPKEVTSTTYKIDEIHGVNKAVVDLPEHKHIDDHYIEDEISEDIMRRNQMTFEYKYDDNGELVPNIQPDGMITTLVNFPDPVEVLKNEWSETLKKHPSTESEIEPTETPH